jgi:hypothetical protein
MHPAPPSGRPGFDQIGGHTFKLENDGVEHVAACAECHGGITSFNDIKAAADYDGNEELGSFAEEFQGVYLKLEQTLMSPPYNLVKGNAGYIALRATSATANDSTVMANYPKVRQAFYNYLAFHYDNSKGIHNPKFAMNTLLRSLNSITGGTGVVPVDPAVPGVYSLSANYPNPFNPSTKIDFSIPKDGNIKINIFNINGQLVATLVDNFVMQGNYTVTWDGRTSDGAMAASGVYFYQLRAPNNTVITKKMSLIK